jgi:hypothetical protein
MRCRSRRPTEAHRYWSPVRAVVAAMVALWGVAGGGAGETLAGRMSERSFEVRSLRLKAGEWASIALHPTARPIELRSSRGALEVCPATLAESLGGGPAGDGDSSWPSFTGFVDCLALDSEGPVTLPTTVSDSLHLAFVVRGRDGVAVRRLRLTVDYQAADAFFAFVPPPVAPGDASARVVVTPRASPTIAAGTYRLDYGRAATGVRAVIRQRGKSLERDGGATSRDVPTFGPAEIGRPVEVRLRNTRDEPIQHALVAEWS